MNNPVIPTAPVNNAITVQPLTTAVPQQGTSAAPNPLANVPNGTIVEGFVINRDTQGNPVLRTPVGDLVVTSDVFLKTGSEVIFRVDATQASRARIVTVDGLSLQDYSTQNTRSAAEDSIATPTLRGNIIAQATTTPASSAVPLAQPVLQALVLQPLNALFANAQKATVSLQVESDTVPEALKNLPSGTSLKLVVFDLELPPLPVSISALPEPHIANSLLGPASYQSESQTTPIPQAQPPVESVTKQTEHAQPLPLPQTSFEEHGQISTKPLPPNNVQESVLTTAASPVSAKDLPTVGNKFVSAQPAQTIISEPQSSALIAAPSAVLSPPAANQTLATSTPPEEHIPFSTAQPESNTTSNSTPFITRGPALHAAVIGHDADGANILHTKFATLKLYTKQPLPTGTTITLQAEVVEPEMAAIATPLSDEMQGITTLTRDWQHLGDALNLLQAQDAALARDLLQQIPNLGPKLTSNLLLFIAAVKGGDVNEWLGKTLVSRLKFAAPDLLKRLTSDITQMQQFFVQSPLTQWSAMMLPMLFGNELQQARLYIRKEEENKKSGPNDRGQRFIIEVDMSHIGDIQFDGFVRSFEKNKSFDLMIRSSKPLNPEISQGIREVFENALQLTGLKGQIAFQQGAQHFVRPLADGPPPSSGGSSNTILA